MYKPALCINKEDHTNPMHQWKTRLIDRRICEDDPNTLQIIPYIVLLDRETDAIFSYMRGPGGNEARLHTKTSIGIGGHIDINVETNIIDTITEEAVREILEETGYHLKPDEIEAFKQKIQNKQYLQIYLSESTNPVDLVHLGIAIVVEINKEDLFQLEENVINNPQWLSVNELRDNLAKKNTTLNLENWSVKVVEEMF